MDERLLKFAPQEYKLHAHYRPILHGRCVRVAREQVQRLRSATCASGKTS